ncbi:MAG: hypothetical protein GAK31_02506 [Stenotrophomonas maltophilia]|uniref:Transmembrane protein n=1 Tax=Stenotrophomonas maltophilia TaxID=40324 RepID=A0A7V8JLD7_STEMA|nr:MAG: hypothetical protein GAK31_02506 [Stenotrophomonas maltophilia]
MTAWDAVNYVLLALGVIALALGYRCSSRNLMLCAGLLLLVFNGVEDFSRGVAEGHANAGARTL